jgi:hypothetical protein
MIVQQGKAEKRLLVVACCERTEGYRGRMREVYGRKDEGKKDGEGRSGGVALFDFICEPRLVLPPATESPGAPPPPAPALLYQARACALSTIK